MIRFTYPITDTDGCMDSLGVVTWFSTLEPNSGYRQVPIAQEGRDKPRVRVSRAHIGFDACRTASLTHWQLFNVRWTFYSLDTTGGLASYISKT